MLGDPDLERAFRSVSTAQFRRAVSTASALDLKHRYLPLGLFEREGDDGVLCWSSDLCAPCPIVRNTIRGSILRRPDQLGPGLSLTLPLAIVRIVYPVATENVIVWLSQHVTGCTSWMGYHVGLIPVLTATTSLHRVRVQREPATRRRTIDCERRLTAADCGRIRARHTSPARGFEAARAG